MNHWIKHKPEVKRQLVRDDGAHDGVWYDSASDLPMINNQPGGGDDAEGTITTAAVVTGDGPVLQNGAGNDATTTGARRDHVIDAS